MNGKSSLKSWIFWTMLESFGWIWVNIVAVGFFTFLAGIVIYWDFNSAFKYGLATAGFSFILSVWAFVMLFSDNCGDTRSRMSSYYYLIAGYIAGALIVVLTAIDAAIYRIGLLINGLSQTTTPNIIKSASIIAVLSFLFAVIVWIFSYSKDYIEHDCV